MAEQENILLTNKAVLVQLKKKEDSTLGVFLMKPSQLSRDSRQRALSETNVKSIYDNMKTKGLLLSFKLTAFITDNSPDIPEKEEGDIPPELDNRWGGLVIRGGHRTEALRRLQAEGQLLDEAFPVTLLSREHFDDSNFVTWLLMGDDEPGEKMPNRYGDILNRLIESRKDRQIDPTMSRKESVYSLAGIAFANRNPNALTPWIKAAYDIHLGPALKKLLRIKPFLDLPANLITSSHTKTNPLLLANYFNEAFALWFLITDNQVDKLEAKHFSELDQTFKAETISLECFVKHIESTQDSLFREFGSPEDIRARLTGYSFQSEEAPSLFASHLSEARTWSFSPVDPKMTTPELKDINLVTCRTLKGIAPSRGTYNDERLRHADFIYELLCVYLAGPILAGKITRHSNAGYNVLVYNESFTTSGLVHWAIRNLGVKDEKASDPVVYDEQDGEEGGFEELPSPSERPLDIAKFDGFIWRRAHKLKMELLEVSEIAKGMPDVADLTALFLIDEKDKKKGTHLFGLFAKSPDWLPFKNAMDLVVACSEEWTELFHTLAFIQEAASSGVTDAIPVTTLFTLCKDQVLAELSRSQTKISIAGNPAMARSNLKKLKHRRDVREQEKEHQRKLTENVRNKNENIKKARIAVEIKEKSREEAGKQYTLSKKQHEAALKNLDTEINAEVDLSPYQRPSSPEYPPSPEVSSPQALAPTRSQPSQTLAPFLPSQPVEYIDVDAEDDFSPEAQILAIKKVFGDRNGVEGFRVVMKAMFDCVGVSSEVMSYLDDPDFLAAAPSLGRKFWKEIFGAYNDMCIEQEEKKSDKKRKDPYPPGESDDGDLAEKRKKAEEELEKEVELGRTVVNSETSSKTKLPARKKVKLDNPTKKKRGSQVKSKPTVSESSEGEDAHEDDNTLKGKGSGKNKNVNRVRRTVSEIFSKTTQDSAGQGAPAQKRSKKASSKVIDPFGGSLTPDESDQEQDENVLHTHHIGKNTTTTTRFSPRKSKPNPKFVQE